MYRQQIEEITPPCFTPLNIEKYYVLILSQETHAFCLNNYQNTNEKLSLKYF